MLALVWTVIGIGLVAALLFGGTSLLNPNASNVAQVKSNSTSMFHSLASAYQAYINANTVAPTTADWQTQLIPGYLPELKYPITGTAWSFGTDVTNGDYFCLSGSMPEAAWDGLAAAAVNYPASSYYYNVTSCTTRSNGSKPSSWPATVYAAYWLKGA